MRPCLNLARRGQNQGFEQSWHFQRSARSIGTFSPALRRPPKFRGQFDLPSETQKYRIPQSVDSTLASGAEQLRRVTLDSISAQDVASQWPPEPLIEKLVDKTPVNQPRVYVSSEEETKISANDIGRFVELSRDELIQLLPEGACGELNRDLTLIPSRHGPVGLMLRRITMEMIMELSALQHAKDRRGNFRINKAGFLIDGHKGTGKSQVLNLLVMWARKNGWLVVLEPAPSRYSHEIAQIKRSNMGVYIQNEFSQQFLEATSLSNRELLEMTPVNFDVYGSRALDGCPVKSTRQLYEPLIEKTVDQEVIDQGLSEVERIRRIAAYRNKVRIPSMTEHLRDPGSVWDIVDFGLQNEAYATQAVAELFAQLQHQDTHPVLVVCDEWNECFPVSEYVSIRYDNTRFHGYIPSYHLSMPRAFHRWDGHQYKRGLKICATTWQKLRRRDYKPELLGVKKDEIRTVRNFTQYEFANFVTYYRLMGILHNFPRDELEYYYMLTQGNGWQARRILTTLY